MGSKGVSGQKRNSGWRHASAVSSKCSSFAEGSKGRDWVLLFMVSYPSNSKRDPTTRWLILPYIESLVICMKLTKTQRLWLQRKRLLQCKMDTSIWAQGPLHVLVCFSVAVIDTMAKSNLRRKGLCCYCTV